MENKTPEQLAREYACSNHIRIVQEKEIEAAKNGFLAGYNARNEEIRDILIRYTENLRDYERESRNLIGFDEREDEEFVDVFLKGG